VKIKALSWTLAFVAGIFIWAVILYIAAHALLWWIG
jgi:hypothetical protein